MRKIVINGCFGGFNLSEAGMVHYAQLKGITFDTSKYGYGREIERDDPALVETVEKLGKAANGSCAELYVVEIPDDVQWQIEEYDGSEHVAEKHRTWQ
jgi:hypothetical protein